MKSDNKNSGKNQERPAKGRPNEIPEKGQSEHERLDYPHEREQEQQQSGSDAAYSEQAGVTPPKPREFPSLGNVKGDFVSKPYGRTTGRMVGYEPGTESI